jgi:hypothetical protein
MDGEIFSAPLKSRLYRPLNSCAAWSHRKAHTTAAAERRPQPGVTAATIPRIASLQNLKNLIIGYMQTVEIVKKPFEPEP